MKFKYSVFFILFLTAFSLNADPLTMDSFIKMVLERHPQLKVYTESEETLLIKSESALSIDKWIYSVKPFINYFGETSAYSYKSLETTQYGTEVSLKTPLGYSGGELGISGSTTAEFNDPITLDQTEEVYKQKISVFYNQSLLKNRSLKESKILEQELKDDYMILVLNNTELTEKIILEFSDLYLEWVYLIETNKLIKLRLDYSEKLLEQINARYRSNLVDAIDILRGKESVLNIRQTLLQYQNRIDLLVNSLKDELDIDISDDVPDFDFYQISSADAEGISFSDISKNRIFQVNMLEKEKLEKTVSRYKSLKQSSLDLNVNLGFSSREDELGNSVSSLYPDAGISLTYSGAFNNEKYNNLISESESRIKTSEMNRLSLVSEYKSLSESLLKQLEQDKALIKTQDELISIAAEKTAEERKYYNQGRGELNYIIQSLDSETQQKIKKNDQLLSLKRNCLKLKELSDSLLAKSITGE